MKVILTQDIKGVGKKDEISQKMVKSVVKSHINIVYKAV